MPVGQAEANRCDCAAEPDDEHPARRLMGAQTELTRDCNVQWNRPKRIPDEAADTGPKSRHVEVAQIRHRAAAEPDCKRVIDGFARRGPSQRRTTASIPMRSEIDARSRATMPPNGSEGFARGLICPFDGRDYPSRGRVVGVSSGPAGGGIC